nr:hypothetical protein [Tanacetum cinerariifolium]
MDDLYNNLKIYEAKVMRSSSTTQNTQNIAFVSFNNTNSTSKAVNTAYGVSAARSKTNASNLPNVNSLSDVMIYSFFASQSNSPQLDNEDLKQIDLDDLEEMDLKWQMAIRGHFARKCRASKHQDNKNREAPRRTMPTIDGPTNFALMAYTSSSSSSSSNSDTEVSTCSKCCLKSYETLKEHYDNLTKDFNKSQFNLGNYMPPKPDLVFVDEHVVSESVTSLPDIAKNKVKTSETKFKNHVKSPRKYVKQEESNRQTKYPRKTSQSPRVLTNFGLKTLNIARHPSLRVAVSVNTARPINIACPRSTVNGKKPSSNVFHKSHSLVRRTFNQRTTPQNSYLKETINTARVNNVTTAGTKAVVSVVQGNRENAVKSSACWIWRPIGNVIDHISKDSGSYMLKRFNYGNPQYTLQDQGIFDSGCSRHMTGNMSYLSEYEEIDYGYVTFGGLCFLGFGLTFAS